MQWRVGIMICVLVLVDQLSKWWLGASSRIEFFSGLAIVGTVNTGSAWGIFSGILWYPYLVAGISFILLVLLFIGYYKFPVSPIILYAGVFAFSGITGNLIDRMVLAGVRDFIDFFGWFVFNLADLYLTIAVMLICWHELLKQKTLKRTNMSKS